MNKFQTLLQNVVRQWTVSRGRRHNSRPIDGQTLEARRVPTVTATLNAAGALALTGDNAPNNITISSNVATGDVTLQGNNGTQITLNGVTAAQHIVDFVNTINGNFGTAADTVNLNSLVVANINVNLGGGDDSLRISNTFSNPVTVNGGDGNNQIRFENVRLGATNITTGTGNDLIDFDRAKVSGGLTIKSGAGDDSVLLDDGGVAGGLRILGALKIETSDGTDRVDLGSDEKSSFGSISIDSGKGDDNVENIEGRVTGALTVKTSDGEDRVDIDGGTFGSISVETGNGNGDIDIDNLATNTLNILTGDQNDVLTIDDVSIAGATNIKTAGGNDKVTIDNGSSPSDFGAMTFDLGNGDNLLNFAHEVSLDALSMTSGSGIDLITVNAVSRGGVTLKTGEGNDDVTLSLAALGSLNIETTGGDDDVQVVDLLIVRGETSIKTGLGNDDVELIAGSGLVNQFGANLIVDLGAELDDDLDVARGRVVGDATLNAEDINIDDTRFKGKAKITAKGGDSASIDIERNAIFAGEVIFEKDAEITLNSVSNDTIDIGFEGAASKTTFKAAAKFKGLVNDPAEVRLELNPTIRVFFNGPAPTFTNAVRIDV